MFNLLRRAVYDDGTASLPLLLCRDARKQRQFMFQSPAVARDKEACCRIVVLVQVHVVRRQPHFPTSRAIAARMCTAA